MMNPEQPNWGRGRNKCRQEYYSIVTIKHYPIVKYLNAKKFNAVDIIRMS